MGTFCLTSDGVSKRLADQLKNPTLSGVATECGPRSRLLRDVLRHRSSYPLCGIGPRHNEKAIELFL